jgi:hypothetical protein
MKTSELRKWAEDNGFKKEMLEESIKSFDLLNGLHELQKRMGIQLIRKVLDYIETPISEREDEKKYYIELGERLDKHDDKRYLNLDHDDGIFFLHDEIGDIDDSGNYYAIFTQQEIDNFPKEIKGAIECGFLRKVEVE